MANVLTVVWLLIGYLCSVSALLVWVALLLPGSADRARRRLTTAPGRCFGLGLVVFVVTFVVAANLIGGGRKGGVQLLGWILTLPSFACLVVGNTGFVRLLQERLRQSMRVDAPVAGLVGAAVCHTLAGLVPLVGWMLYLPLVIGVSLGAGLLALRPERRRKEAPVASPETLEAGAAAPERG